MNNKSKKIMLFVVLGLIFLGFIIYIIYNVFFTNKSSESLPKWAEYLFEQDITNIYIDNRNDLPFDIVEGCPKSEKITKEQLYEIIDKMTDTKLIKYLEVDCFSNYCPKGIVIEYNDNQTLKFSLNKHIFTDDNELLSLLENEKYVTKNRKEYASECESFSKDVFTYEWDDSFLNDILK